MAQNDTPRPSPKLDWKRIGPVRVKERLGPVTYRIELPATYKIHDIFHISLLTPVKPDTILGRQQSEPQPIMVWQQGEGGVVEEEQFIMERYVNSRWIKRDDKWSFQFKVKWDSANAMTWEDRECLDEDTTKTNDQYLRPGDDDFDMEQEFYDRHPDAPHHGDPVGKRVNVLGM